MDEKPVSVIDFTGEIMELGKNSIMVGDVIAYAIAVAAAVVINLAAFKAQDLIFPVAKKT